MQLLCGICFDTICQEGRLNSCDHKFCFSCIAQWADILNRCPICQRSFTCINSPTPSEELLDRALSEAMQRLPELPAEDSSVFADEVDLSWLDSFEWVTPDTPANETPSLCSAPFPFTFIDTDQQLRTVEIEAASDSPSTSDDSTAIANKADPSAPSALTKAKNTLTEYFTCPLAGCQKSFRRRSDLNRHLLIHSKQKNFVCGQCGRAFTLSADLRRHERLHSEERPYACRECDKSFKLKTQLNRHRLIHLGVRKYACEDCQKTFTQKGDLNRHRAIHKDERRFVCNIADCGKRFRQKAHLLAHKKTPHRRIPGLEAFVKPTC